MKRKPVLEEFGKQANTYLTRSLLGALTLLAMTACSPADAGDGPGGPSDPLALKPSATAVLALDDEFEFAYMPGAQVSNLEWDVEAEYDTRDVPAVFEHYDAELTAVGFERTSIEREDDEVEANYRNPTTNVTVELEVDRDDNRVDADMDIENLSAFDTPPTGFSLTEFLGVEVPFYQGAQLVDLEWDFNFDHPGTSAADVFAFYDQQLQDLGWRQIELDDDDDDEWEAEYVLEGVYLELEAEDGTEVEIEVNKLRFYQN